MPLMSKCSSLLERFRVRAAAYIGASLLRLLNATLRWSCAGRDPRKLFGDEKPIVAAFWHGRQLLMPWAFLNYRPGGSRRIYALASEHQDGRIMAEGMRRIGIDSVAGSSSKSAVRALQSLIDRIREGHHVAITPDGPRGQRHKAKPGAVALAMHTGAAVVPAAFSAARNLRMRSWDGMMVPLPFSRAVYVIGEPFEVPPDLSDTEFERYRLRLEQELNKVTAEADRLMELSHDQEPAPFRNVRAY